MVLGFAKDILVALFSILIPICVVVLGVIIGWYLVWKLFLSRFRFIRELIGSLGETPTHVPANKTKTTARRD